MMIAPSLLPDEADRGYLGRIMRINGVRKQSEVVPLLARLTGMAGKSRRQMPFTLLLGKAAGIGQQEFVRQHTLLPLRRAITSYQPTLAHGCESNLSMAWYSAMRLARVGAYFCKQCVNEDLGFHGFSYWRREHQIPGLFWCPKHSAPLSYRGEEAALLSAPDRFVEDCYPVLDSWALDARDNPLVDRFVAICSALLERSVPFGVKCTALPVLRNRAALLGFQTNSKNVRRPLLSDAVVNGFGRQWLATVLPSLAAKQEGELTPQMDGVLFLSTSASSATAYVLALSVLFDSPEDALNALIQGAPPRARQRKARQILQSQDVRSAYIKAGGSYSRAADALASSHAAVGRRLRSMGLPDLRAKPGALEMAARAFFIERNSLSDSASCAGINLSQLEELVRTAGANFIEVLDEMSAKPKADAGLNNSLPYRLAPHEVQCDPGRMAPRFTRSLRWEQRKRLASTRRG